MVAATSQTLGTVSHPVQLASSGKKVVKPTPRVTLSSLTPNNVGTLRTLNNAIFPVHYSDKFYSEVLAPELEEFNKLIYYADVPVGSITCRFEPPLDASNSSSTSPLQLHILTLNVLPPYRSQGLGSQLLKNVLSQAASYSSPGTPVAPATNGKAAAAPAKKDAPPPPTVGGGRKIDTIKVMCQVGNEEAKKFYVEKGNFKEIRVVDNYYVAVEPRAAVLLEKNVSSSTA